jgi:hypothetical protein
MQIYVEHRHLLDSEEKINKEQGKEFHREIE